MLMSKSEVGLRTGIRVPTGGLSIRLIIIDQAYQLNETCMSMDTIADEQLCVNWQRETRQPLL